jgi:hypothetical protein
LLLQQLRPLLLHQERCQLFLQKVKLVGKSQSSTARPRLAPHLLYNPLHRMRPLLQRDQQLL